MKKITALAICAAITSINQVRAGFDDLAPAASGYYQTHHDIAEGARVLKSISWGDAYGAPWGPYPLGAEHADPDWQVVVREAEDYDAVAAGSGVAAGYEWSLATAVAGYSGGGYMQSTAGDANTGDETVGPRMDYSVEIDVAGTWYVWVRTYATDASSDSVIVGLADQAGAIGGATALEWAWDQDSATGVVAFTVPAAGRYTFSVWMREGGVAIDKLIMITQQDYTPTDLGPHADLPWVTLPTPTVGSTGVWRFNETSGVSFAPAEGGATWTGNAFVTAGQAGIWDYAFRCQAPGSMTAPYFEGLNTGSITVSTWLKVDLDEYVGVASNTFWLGRSGQNPSWQIITEPYSDGGTLIPYITMRLRRNGEVSGGQHVRLHALYDDAWNHLIYSYDEHSGVLKIWLNGQMVQYLPMDAAPLDDSTGGLAIAGAAWPFNMTELVILPYAIEDVEADCLYRKGACGIRAQISRDGGTIWTDHNNVEGAYIYSATDTPDASVTLNLPATDSVDLRFELWSYDVFHRTPAIEGLAFSYNVSVPNACYITTVEAADAGPGFFVAFEETVNVEGTGQVKYRVSPTGEWFYTYNTGTTAWELVPYFTYNAGTTMTAAELTAALPTYTDEVGATMYVQAFLISDDIYEVELDQMSVTYVEGAVYPQTPAGGAEIDFDSDTAITWTAAGIISDSWDVHYSTDAQTWVAIVEAQTINAVAGTYSLTWPVPEEAESATARIRIRDASSPLVVGTTLPFTIQPPPLRWLTPITGSSLLAGAEYTGTWAGRPGLALSADNGAIDYSIDAGQTWIPIRSGIDLTAGTLPTPETVPIVDRDGVYMRIRDLDNGYSDVNIVDIGIGLQIDMPAKIYAGTRQTIPWTSSAGTSNRVDVAYSIDAGQTWTYAARVANAIGTNAYTLQTPNIPTKLQIKIVDINDPTLYATTTINAAKISLTAPVAGQEVDADAEITIAWTSRAAGDTVIIEYATSTSLAIEPTTWITIAAAAPNVDGVNTYVWTVDQFPSSRARVRITSNSDRQLRALSPEFNIGD